MGNRRQRDTTLGTEVTDLSNTSPITFMLYLTIEDPGSDTHQQDVILARSAGTHDAILACTTTMQNSCLLISSYEIYALDRQLPWLLLDAMERYTETDIVISSNYGAPTVVP